MLTETIAQFLALERTLGRLLKKEGELLENYAAFARARDEMHVRAETAITWASQSTSPQQRERRLSFLTRFARYARLEDPAHEIPPGAVFAETKRHPCRLPYIFSAAEIAHMLNATAMLEPIASLRPKTFRTLFALLADTGLCVSEALALRLDDFADDTLFIRTTKFWKSRLVPVHPSTTIALKEYIAARSEFPHIRDDSLFISLRGRRMRYAAARNAFGIVAADLRASPSVQRRAHIPEGRDKIDRHMRALSIYLGHGDISDTYWYCHATPLLMKNMADAAEQHFSRGGR